MLNFCGSAVPVMGCVHCYHLTVRLVCFRGLLVMIMGGDKAMDRGSPADSFAFVAAFTDVRLSCVNIGFSRQYLGMEYHLNLISLLYSIQGRVGYDRNALPEYWVI